MEIFSDEVINRFFDEGLILTTHGFSKIAQDGLEDKIDEIIEKAKENNVWLITNEFIEEFVKIKPKKEVDEVVVERPSKEIISKEISSNLKIKENSDVTGKSSCTGKVEDFLDYFNKKYGNLKNILEERPNLKGIPINAIRGYPNELVSIIVMIKDKRESKRGFKLLEVEDTTGELTVLVPKDNRIVNEIYERLLLDEVIGISGVLRNNLFIAQEIFEPDLPITHKPIFSDEEINVAFLSDIHVGSYLFFDREFENFINFLNLKNNNGHNKEIAEKVKYVIVAGDLVDGIGVYPQQERELAIPDIYKQYDFLSSLLEKIPNHIEIILSVGNHDAVRGSEPQPKLDKDIAKKLYEMPNVHLVGNPIFLEIDKVKILVYHGTSLDTIIGSLADCSYSRPETAMIEYLKKRYLVPVYGNDSLAPEKEDFLTIKEIPDILHCGHVHCNGYANYRGVSIINSGTFQGRTKYQEQQGHLPTPAKVPIINLQNFEVSTIQF